MNHEQLSYARRLNAKSGRIATGSSSLLSGVSDDEFQKYGKNKILTIINSASSCLCEYINVWVYE